MKAAINVLVELFQNIVIINRLSINELITKHKGNALGVIWLWVNPVFQIGLYAFIFGYGIRNRKPVDGHEFFYWLIAGYVPWLYISSVVTKASRSIVAKMGLVTKMRFPVSITPAVVVISELYIHLLMLATIMLVFIFSDNYSITKYWIYLPYFTVAATCFLYSLSLFNSALTTIIRDYQHIVYNVMRVMFYLTPILFPMNTMASGLKTVIKLNPLTYIVEGYRDCLLYGRRMMFMSFRWGAWFWAITIILFIAGSILQSKMKKNLLDYA